MHNTWTLARGVMAGVLAVLGAAAVVRGEMMQISPWLWALGAWSAAALIWATKGD